MIKISEKEIERCLQEFNKKDITLNIQGLITAEVKIVIAKCVYDKKVGIIRISNSQVKFEFNTSDLYRISIGLNGKVIQMYFDNGIFAIIEK